MHRWEVASGLLFDEVGSLLLVENHRGAGRVDWTPPGGVVDSGESGPIALTREVAEETGLTVVGWSPPIYRVEVLAPDMGWHLTVVCHEARAWSGDIVHDDPDGIVRSAAWVDPRTLGDHLAGSPLWVSEPLLAWRELRASPSLAEPHGTVPVSRFTARGTSRHDLTVERG